LFLAQLVVIIVAALFLTAEYRRGMIRVTLAATPSRTKVLAAKSLVIFLATFVASLISACITFPLALHLLKAGGNPIDPLPVPTEVRMVVGTALLIAVSAVLALAIAALTRRAVFAIPAVIVVVFIPFMLTTGSGLLGQAVQEWLLRVLPVSAYAVQQAYPVYHQVNALYNPANGYYPLAGWAGLGVELLWTAVALGAAAWMLRRRDA
jgi:ABC-type transport system involved in multi-copper enzyme maturation permease subunit